MSSGKKSGQQQAAESIESQAGQLKTGQNAAATGTLSQFEGPVDQSPFYKSLLNTGIESTSRAYDNAKANSRARANMAGYGYAQPAEQGNEMAMDAQESSALADVPRRAMLDTAPLALQASGQSAGIARGASADELAALDMADSMNQRRRAGTTGLFSALSKIGPAVAAPFTG